MGAMASQITSLTIVYSTVHLGVDQRKHQSSASLAFVRGLHRWLVNSPHKRPVTQKIFPFATSSWYMFPRPPFDETGFIYVFPPMHYVNCISELCFFPMSTGIICFISIFTSRIAWKNSVENASIWWRHHVLGRFTFFKNKFYYCCDERPKIM